LLVWLHRDKVSPYMNGLHFFFGIGTVLAPLLVAQVVQAGRPFTWTYWIIALLLLPITILLWVAPSPTAPHKEANAAPQLPVNWLLVGLFALFFLTFVGSEGAYGGWIHSYAVATQIATPVTAAYLTSAYWGAFTLSRLISIPLALRLRPYTLLVIDLVGCLVGLGLAVAGGGSPAMIWLATIIFGASNATLFPVSMSFAGQTITVTGQFCVSSLWGQLAMLVPWLNTVLRAGRPQSAMVIMLLDAGLRRVFVALTWVSGRK
jgi:FHS family Na+ dependent glucose MFS transporter 1